MREIDVDTESLRQAKVLIGNSTQETDAALAGFIAELEGQAVAAAAVSLHDGVALLAGASTIPTARRQGAQLALLETRLRYAAAEGCDLAMICAQPGSASQRNAERQGFRIAYTRLKWAAAQTSGVS